MKEFNQVLVHVIILLAMMFVSVLLFNHVYAWLGVAGFAVTIYAAVYMTIKAFNKLNSKQDEK